MERKEKLLGVDETGKTCLWESGSKSGKKLV